MTLGRWDWDERVIFTHNQQQRQCFVRLERDDPKDLYMRYMDGVATSDGHTDSP